MKNYLKQHLSTVFYIALFAVLWAWAWLWWGDVLWVAQERSFFAFDTQLMEFALCQHAGWLKVAGRALLALAAWPWLGGFVMASLLTLIALSVATILKRLSLQPTVADILAALIPIAMIACYTHISYGTFFFAETGWFFGIPLLVAVIVLVAALFCIPLRAKDSKGPKSLEDPKAFNILRLSYCLPFVCLCAIIYYEKEFKPHLRPTAAMERYYANNDWQGIINTANENAKVSCRPMAAYYAIALVQTNQLMSRLFDIRFEYDDPFLTDWSGKEVQSSPYYVAECDMHAGLLQFAYHKAMEEITMNGPTKHGLKILCQVATMRHEHKVADKYLSMLERTTGTSDFTRQWRTYNTDTLALESDPNIVSIRQLEPIHDSFETMYTEPAFLGYNLSLYEGRSQRALINSIAVCLYTKLMPPFLERAQYLDVNSITQNKVIADALALQSLKKPEILQILPNLQMNQQHVQGFISQMKIVGATGNTEERMPFAEDLFEQGRGFYPYYYYFGNLRATTKDAAKRYGYSSNSGVN